MDRRLIDVWAIVLNFNGLNDTLRALDSISAVDSVSLNIIVVDNGSDRDESVAIQHVFPNIRVERLDQNVGFARGVNHAATIALREGATHLLLMNSDARVEDGNAVLSELLDQFERNPRLAAVGPLIVDDSETGSLQSAGYRYSLWMPVPIAMRDVGKSKCFFASGSFLLVDAVHFAELHGLDPDFFLYGEDLDFAARLRAANLAVEVVKSASIRHRRGASSRILSNRYIYTALRGNLINIRKHSRWYHRPTALLTSVAISGALVLAAAGRGNVKGLRAVIAAWRDFYAGRWGGLNDGFVLAPAYRPTLTDVMVKTA